MEDVKNANGYPVNKAVEELMNVVTRGWGTSIDKDTLYFAN